MIQTHIMSIWSRSHSDLAKLAKSLKDRNAQTRQGLIERGRPTERTRDDSFLPAPSSPQPALLDVAYPPDPPSDKLNLSDSYALGFNFVERGRVDSFSSADSAISPDFHGGPHGPLSPILRKSTSSDISTARNNLLAPGNVQASPRGADKKVTFLLEREEVSAALSNGYEAERVIADTKSVTENNDSSERSNVLKVNGDSFPVNENSPVFQKHIQPRKPEITLNGQNQCNGSTYNTAVNVASSSVILSQQIHSATSDCVPAVCLTDVFDSSSLETAVNHKLSPSIHISSAEIHGHYSKFTNSEDVLKSDDHFGMEVMSESNSVRFLNITNPNALETGTDNFESNTRGVSPIQNGAANGKSSICVPNSSDVLDTSKTIAQMTPGNLSFASKTVVDTSSSAENLVSPSVVSPLVPPKDDNYEQPMSPASSLNLSNELHTLLISVLAEHKKKQNLQRKERASLDNSLSSINDETAAIIATKELINEKQNFPTESVGKTPPESNCDTERLEKVQENSLPEPPTSPFANANEFSHKSEPNSSDNFLPFFVSPANNIEPEEAPGECVISQVAPSGTLASASFQQSDFSPDHKLRRAPPEKPFESLGHVCSGLNRPDTLTCVSDTSDSMTGKVAAPDSRTGISSSPQPRSQDFTIALQKALYDTSSAQPSTPSSHEFSISTNRSSENGLLVSPALQRTQTRRLRNGSKSRATHLLNCHQSYPPSFGHSKDLNAYSFRTSPTRGYPPPILFPSLHKTDGHSSKTLLCYPVLWQDHSALLPSSSRASRAYDDIVSTYTSSPCVNAMPYLTPVRAEIPLSFTHGDNKVPSLIWNLSRSIDVREGLKRPKAYAPYSFASNTEHFAPSVPTVFGSKFWFSGCLGNGHNNRFCPTQYSNDRNFIPPQCESFTDNTDDKAPGSAVDLDLSLDEEIPSTCFSLADIETPSNGDNTKSFTRVQERDHVEISQQNGSGIGVTSGVKIDFSSQLCDNSQENNKSPATQKTNGHQDGDSLRAKSLSNRQDAVPDAGFTSGPPNVTSCVAGSDALLFSQSPVDVNYTNNSDEELELKVDTEREKDSFHSEEKDSLAGKGKVKSLGQSIQKFVEQDNNGEGDAQAHQSNSPFNTAAACSQFGTQSEMDLTRTSSSGCDYLYTSLDSSYGANGKSDESYLDLSLDTPSSRAKSHSNSYRARIDRINDNVSRFLLSQFPDSLKSGSDVHDAKCQTELETFSDVFATSSPGYGIRKKVKNKPLGTSVSPTSQTHFRPLSPGVSQASTHDTVCSRSSASSTVLVDILKSIKILSGRGHQSTTTRGSTDTGMNGKHRLSITRKELKKILKQLKISHDSLTANPAPELRAVRDDLQKLSASLTQQLCRSKASLDRDILHRNTIFQTPPSRKHPQECNSMNSHMTESSQCGSVDASSVATNTGTKPTNMDGVLNPCPTNEKETDKRKPRRVKAVDKVRHISGTSTDMSNITSRNLISDNLKHASIAVGKYDSLPNKVGKNVKIWLSNFNSESKKNKSNASGDSLSKSHASIRVKEPIAGVEEAERLIHIMLGRHNTKEKSSGAQVTSVKALKPRETKSSAKSRSQRKRGDVSAFREMYRFMCEELSLSTHGGDESNASLLSEHETQNDRMLDDTPTQEENFHFSLNPYVSSELALQEQHQNQQQNHQQKPHLPTHSVDTHMKSKLTTSIGSQNLNRTFCLQNSSNVGHVKVRKSQHSTDQKKSLTPEEETAQHPEDQEPQLSAEDSEIREITAGQSQQIKNCRRQELQKRQQPQEQKNPTAEMESDSDITFQLDREFDKHLADMKPFVLKLPQKSGKFILLSQFSVLTLLAFSVVL